MSEIYFPFNHVVPDGRFGNIFARGRPLSKFWYQKMVLKCIINLSRPSHDLTADQSVRCKLHVHDSSVELLKTAKPADLLSCVSMKTVLTISVRFSVTAMSSLSLSLLQAKSCICHMCGAHLNRLHSCLYCVFFACFAKKHIHEHAKSKRHNLGGAHLLGTPTCASTHAHARTHMRSSVRET